MVECKVPGLASTILADVLVAVEHLLLRQLSLVPRALDHIDKPDYRRYGEGCSSGMNLSPAILQHFGFATEDEDYRPTRTTQIKSFIALIQHQDWRVYHD